MARSGLAGAVRVARWADAALGPGRNGATADGKATLSDATAERAARDLGLTVAQVRADWDTARLAGLVEVHGDSARPGWRLRAWDRDDSAVLRGWVALFDAWSLAYPEPTDHEPAAVAEVVSAMPQVLSFLQLSAGPVPVEQLLDLLRQRVTELRTERCEVPYGPPPGPAAAQAPASGPTDPAALLPTAAEPAAAPPASHGGTSPAASPQASGTAEPAAGAELAPLLDWALRALASVGALTYGDGQATLTPLGSWAVWVKLEQICVAAQSPAGNIEQSAEAMLRGCAQLRPNAARAEYRAWLAARPVGSAVTELLEAARGDDALLRGLAFEALRVVGAPAEPDVRAVVDEPALRPYALLWLAEHDGVDPEDAHEVLTREEATWLWVDTAAAVADHGEAPMLVRHLESAVQPTVPALLNEVRAVGHPRTVQVLVALAAAHPDPALAKAVRRAAFQVHTGGR
jgi:phosphoribosyl-ATP pyrophosphohydrolase